MSSQSILRNNVDKVIRKTCIFMPENIDADDVETRECWLQQRLVRMNSIRDLMFIETVLLIPSKNEIWQIAVSEPYRNYDKIECSRNYEDVYKMADYQWDVFTKEIFSMETDDYNYDLECLGTILPIFRKCDYFNIGADNYNVELLKYADRWIVYGHGRAWDYGNSEDSGLRANKKFNWLNEHEGEPSSSVDYKAMNEVLKSDVEDKVDSVDYKAMNEVLKSDVEDKVDLVDQE